MLEQSIASVRVQPLLLVDASGQVRQSTDGFSQIFFPVQAGDTFFSYIHPEEREEFLTWFKNLDHQTQTHAPIKNLRMMDKTGRVVTAMLRPESFHEGFILWFWEGKTARESADEYWQTAMTPAMEAILASILDGVFLTNVEGKLIEVNQALCTMLGYHKFELLGLSIGKLFGTDTQEIQRATLRFARIMKTGKVQEVNLKLVDRGGAELEVSFNGAVIRSESNQLTGILGICRDLRESKMMRDLKQKTTELEKAMQQLNERDRVKDDFLSVVGHELRTPLANIMGYAEFLLEGDLKPAEKIEFIQVVYQESRRLARLVNEILDLSRLEAGRLIYHYVLQRIDPILAEAVDSVHAEAENKQIKITPALNCPLEAWIDRDRIKQVAINLLNNAIKYSPSHTEIKIESSESEDGVLVSVIDQGMGIAPENVAKVFEKFSRVESVEHHTQGAGLGLPIAKRIIEEGHNGKIWLQSPGLTKGSTFYFWMPKVGKNAA